MDQKLIEAMRLRLRAAGYEMRAAASSNSYFITDPVAGCSYSIRHDGNEWLCSRVTASIGGKSCEEILTIAQTPLPSEEVPS